MCILVLIWDSKVLGLRGLRVEDAGSLIRGFVEGVELRFLNPSSR